MKYSRIVLCAILVFVSMSCEKNRNSVSDIQDTVGDRFPSRFEVQIVSHSNIPLSWDSTYYQHDPSWKSAFDSLAADSLARELVKNRIRIAEMWYPQTDFMCAVPIKAGSEVIVRLERSDDNLINLGFERATNFPVACCAKWRHYQFVK